MLIEHTITRLNDMRLTGMSEAYSSQRERPNINELSFDERFSLMVDQEWTCHLWPTQSSTVWSIIHIEYI
jgi:hypothetical protein